jgi:hypothetical protein
MIFGAVFFGSSRLEQLAMLAARANRTLSRHRRMTESDPICDISAQFLL